MHADVCALNVYVCGSLCVQELVQCAFHVSVCVCVCVCVCVFIEKATRSLCVCASPIRVFKHVRVPCVVTIVCVCV
jgi:hypothetical protein